MSITFYYSPRSSATRVHWALEELGIAYEKVRVDLSAGEQKKPEYLAINPNGKVPALVDGDARMFESLAIVLHLGERYGVDRGLWPNAGTPERAEALSWSVWSMVTVQHVAMEYAYHTDTPMAWPAEVQQKTIADYMRDQWTQCMRILDARLAATGHVVGSSFTFADLLNANAVGIGKTWGKLPIEPHTNVVSWLERTMQRPASVRVRGDS